MPEHSGENARLTEKQVAQLEREAWLAGFRAHRDGDQKCEHGYQKGDHHWESGDCLAARVVPQCDRRDNHSHARIHSHLEPLGWTHATGCPSQSGDAVASPCLPGCGFPSTRPSEGQ